MISNRNEVYENDYTFRKHSSLPIFIFKYQVIISPLNNISTILVYINNNTLLRDSGGGECSIFTEAEVRRWRGAVPRLGWSFETL